MACFTFNEKTPIGQDQLITTLKAHSIKFKISFEFQPTQFIIFWTNIIQLILRQIATMGIKFLLFLFHLAIF